MPIAGKTMTAHLAVRAGLVFCLMLVCLVVVLPLPISASTSWPPNNLKIDWHPCQIGQVSILNGSSYYEVMMKMDVMYHGISPPK